MKINYEVRYAAHPADAKNYDTARLRKDFLIENLMVADEINMVYTMYDRLIVGGAVPVNEKLELTPIDPLKAPFFLHRRELGIFNVGGEGTVEIDGTVYELGYKEVLYLGKGDRNPVFASKDPSKPAHFYFSLSAASKAQTTVPSTK